MHDHIFRDYAENNLSIIKNHHTINYFLYNYIIIYFLDNFWIFKNSFTEKREKCIEKIVIYLNIQK